MAVNERQKVELLSQIGTCVADFGKLDKPELFWDWKVHQVHNNILQGAKTF